MRYPLHADEHTTCPIVDAPDNYHFELCCEDCAVKELARLNLDRVEGRYYAGRITQDAFEAYMFVWALLSPSGSKREWRATPKDRNVRRIARKLLRIRDVEAPADLVDVTTDAVVDLSAGIGEAS